MVDFADLSLTEAADAVSDGRVTSLELLNACWTNMDKANARVNATIWLDREGAEAAARAADAAVQAGKARGRPLGKLHGVPMAHKDMYYQAGRPCTCGSALRRDFVPTYPPRGAPGSSRRPRPGSRPRSRAGRPTGS